jgi:hypothetical protein
MLCMKISCHMHKLKTILTDYIYHQNEKSKPPKKHLLQSTNDIINILDT